MKNNLSSMIALNVYLSSLNKEEYDKIKHRIKPKKTKMMPLHSWDIFSQQHFKKLKTLKTKRDLEEVKKLAKKGVWKNDLNAIFENNIYEALIITDIEQTILWVNDGFSEMTGYPKLFAINKKPNFLQGANTSSETKNAIRRELKKLKPFTQIITNYKKDNTPYECEVKIIPLYNNEVTHFLALERKIG